MKRNTKPANQQSWLGTVLAMIAIIVSVVALVNSMNSSHVAEQAWISPKEGATLAPIDSDRGRVVQLFTNTGHTPAQDVMVSYYILFLSSDTTEEQLAASFRDNDAQKAFSKAGSVPPGGPLQIDADGPVNSFEGGKQSMYFRIRIEYKDVFGKKHRTYDCSKLSVADAKSVAYGLCPVGKLME